MSFYIAPKWEVDAQTGAFRKYCDVTNNLPTELYCYGAWATDGSVIGRYTSFSRTATGADIPRVAAAYHYPLPSNFFPEYAASRFYPVPIINQNGGWKYTPINLGLPTTLTLPNDVGYGFPTDVKLNFSTISSTTRRITITDVTFDTAWNTIFLVDTAGDGAAYETTRVVNRVTYPLFGWNVNYSANWRTLHNKNGTSGADLIYGNSRGSVYNPNNIADGDYLLSDLIAQNTAAWREYGDFTLTGATLYTSHYQVS